MENDVNVFRVDPSLRWILSLIVVVSVIFLLIPFITIFVAWLGGAYHHALLVTFMAWILPVILVAFTKDLFRYKIVITSDCIVAPKLRGIYLGYDDSNVQEIVAQAHRSLLGTHKLPRKGIWVFGKGVEKIAFGEVAFANARKIFVGTFRKNDMCPAYEVFIVFTLKDGVQKRVYIELSGKEKDKIIEALGQRIAVYDNRSQKEREE